MKKMLIYEQNTVETALNILNTLRIAEGLDNADKLSKVAQLLRQFQFQEVEDKTQDKQQEGTNN